MVDMVKERDLQQLRLPKKEIGKKEKQECKIGWVWMKARTQKNICMILFCFFKKKNKAKPCRETQLLGVRNGD